MTMRFEWNRMDRNASSTVRSGVLLKGFQQLRSLDEVHVVPDLEFGALSVEARSFSVEPRSASRCCCMFFSFRWPVHFRLGLPASYSQFLSMEKFRKDVNF